MSVTSLVEHVVLEDLKDPILITAFSSPHEGGTTAATALSYAIEKWQVEPVANFMAEGCYNYGRQRPLVQRLGDKTVVHWPENLIYRIDGPDHTYLVLIGIEPTLNWREFVEGIGEYVQRLGVKTAINLKSLPAMVPHTLETPLRAIFSAPELKAEFDFEELEDQDGPADIGRILNLHLAAKDCRTIDLYAMRPFYAAGMPDASGCVRLLLALKESLDLSVDLQDLREAAVVQRRAIDAAVASSEQLRETVTALESRIGPSTIQLPLLSQPAEDLDTAEIMSEAEAIFNGFGPGTAQTGS